MNAYKFFSLAALTGFCLVASPSLARSNGPGPSFSCEQAREGSVEDMICSDADLSRQDRVMATAYSDARAAVRGSEGLGELMSTQQAWLRERANCINLRTQKGLCVEFTTKDRIEVLWQWKELRQNPNRQNPNRTQPSKTGTNTSSRPPQGPSFNCANARTSVERKICADRDLSRHDRQVASLYAQQLRLVSSNPNHTRFVQADQRDFITNRNRCDRRPQVISACLTVAYENRIMRLEELIEEIRARP
jgi:uncharacterized protein